MKACEVVPKLPSEASRYGVQGNLQPATALYLPEAAPSKGLRPDASFSGIKADVTSSSPPSTLQPPSSHTSAATRRTADEMLTALRKVPAYHSLAFTTFSDHGSLACNYASVRLR